MSVDAVIEIKWSCCDSLWDGSVVGTCLCILQD